MEEGHSKGDIRNPEGVDVNDPKSLNCPAYWDEVYRFEHSNNLDTRRDTLRWNLILNEIGDGLRVLDYGCGLGDFLKYARCVRPNCRLFGLDFSKYAIEEAKKMAPAITYVTSILELPEFQQSGYFQVVTCFPAGTMVFCGDSINPIEEIKVGDKVLSSKGTIQKVKNTFKKLYSGEMFNIKVRGLKSIKVTPEHPIQVVEIKRKHIGKSKYVYEYSEPVWKEASKITKQDWVMLPRYQNNSNQSIYLRVGKNYNQKGDFRDYTEFKLDKELAWIIGLWVAEGYTSQTYRVAWALGAHRISQINQLTEILSKKGFKFNVQTNNNASVVNICNKDFVDLLSGEIGTYAWNKKIPRWIFDSNPEIINSFLKGYLSGDGHIYKGDARISTVSKKLLYGLGQLLIKIGIPYSYLSEYPPKAGIIQGRKVNCKRCYRLQFSHKLLNGEEPSYLKSKISNDYIYSRVTKVEKSVEELEVYNFETEDNTYCVPFIVHNCQHVVEHLEDPLAFCQDIKKLVKKGGLLILTLPINDDDWREHFKIWQVQDMIDLCQKLDYKVAKFVHRTTTKIIKKDGSRVQEMTAFMTF